jgi:hypothetical protein
MTIPRHARPRPRQSVDAHARLLASVALVVAVAALVLGLFATTLGWVLWEEPR